MPGIVVGVDDSAHARQALDWAMREAAARQMALTVLTARKTADEAVAKSASEISGPVPVSVTVNVSPGTRPRLSLTRRRTPSSWSSGHAAPVSPAGA